MDPDHSNGSDLRLSSLDEEQLAALARAAVDELQQRPAPGGFRQLIELSAYVGTAIGQTARQYAERESWSQVAAVSGTSKQAAWSRWR